MPRSIDDSLRSVALACALVACATVQAAPPHEHGVGQLAAAVEGEALSLSFSLPLDSLLGFERAPRSAAEKQAVAQAVDKLRRVADMVRPDAAARCEPSDVTLVSAALGLGGAVSPASPAQADEHADLDATYTFRCRDIARLTQIELPLMTAFPRVARIEAQTVSAKGQGKQSLKRASPKLAWPR